MAASLVPAGPSAQPAPVPGHAAGSFGLVVRSEWTKLRSVRSTFWALVVTMVGAVGLGALISFSYVTSYNHLSFADRARADATGLSLAGIFLAQLAIGVLGVLTITSEYRTGMIRATLSAVPKRGRVLAAKATVFAATALVVGLVSSFVAFFVGQAVLSGQSLQTTIGAPEVLRAVVGGGLYLTVVGLLGLGLGAVIRQVAGAIAVLVALVFVLPGVAMALPASWQHVVVKVLPSDTGGAVYRVHHMAQSLGPWAGFGVLCAWAAVSLALGWLLMARRDA